MTFALSAGLVSPALAAESEVIAEISDDDKKTAVLPESESNKNVLNYLELVDSFVTAERRPTNRWETPANVYVITAQEIEDNHYQSIEEALEHLNGIFYAFINASDRTLLLVDGQRTYSAPSMKAIERIEIVKGAGSALYGSDAVGGVINIITKKGTINETTVDFMTGSWRTNGYEITNQGVKGKFSWFIDANILKGNIHKLTTDEVVPFSDSDEKDVHLRLDNKFDSRSSVTVTYWHGGNKYNRNGYNQPQTRALYYNYEGTPIPVVTRDGVVPYTGLYMRLLNRFSVNYNFKEGTSTPGFLHYTYDYDSDNKPIFDFTADGKKTRHSISYQNGWELDNHKIIAGAEWSKENAVNAFWHYTDKQIVNSAIYLQDTISITDKWTLVPGVRFDHNNTYGNNWSPKFSANYRADNKTKFYATWGKFYREPTFYELYTSSYQYTDFLMNDGTTERFLTHTLLGNRDLKPEIGHTETIGFEHDFDDKTRLSGSFFYSKIKSNIALEDTLQPLSYSTPGIFWRAQSQYTNSNFGETNRGFELNFLHSLNDNFSYELGYSYLHRSAPTNSPNFMTGYFRLPKNGCHVGLHYRDGAFRTNLFGVFGRGSNDSVLALKSFAMLDFNASYDVADWATIYFSCLNLTNKDHAYFNTINSQRRSFWAGVNCRF